MDISRWAEAAKRTLSRAFDEQIRWLRNVLSNRGMPSSILELHLHVLSRQLTRSIPENEPKYCCLATSAERLRLAREQQISPGRHQESADDFVKSVGGRATALLVGVAHLLVSAVADEKHRLELLSNRRAFPPLDGIGEFAGCLYVVQGSALGGRTILLRVACGLSIEQSCRFLTSGGTNTARIWKQFVRFCDSQCCGPEARREAFQSAQRVFEFVADCLTYAESELTTDGESQGDRASANNRSHSDSRTPLRMSHSASGVRSTNSSAARSV